jgi:initiation factor 1A
MAPKFGGKKGKKLKKHPTEITMKYADEDGLLYASVIKKLGDMRFNVKCFDGNMRIGKLCGRLRNKARIMENDIVMISTREYDTFDKNCDIIYKYSVEQIIELEKKNIIKIEKKHDESINIEFDDNVSSSDDSVVFDRKNAIQNDNSPNVTKTGSSTSKESSSNTETDSDQSDVDIDKI